MNRDPNAAGVVVVGGGQGGCDVAAALRANGYDGSITLICAEAEIPYSRPGLSKGYLLEHSGEEALELRPQSFYTDQRIDMVLSASVTAVDRAARLVRTSGGTVYNYEALVLATGGLPRQLDDLPAAENVHYVRTFADARRLKTAIGAGSRVGVIGAGYVGLEVAAAARQLGAAVTLIHRGPALLQRVTSRPVSDFFSRLHREEGVDLRFNSFVTSYETDSNRVRTLVLTDDSRLEVDTLVIGVGLEPQTELAAEAGLEVADGVLVDDDCRTNDPSIYAIGDCARYPCDVTGTTRRLESVPNASAHARTVAAAILGQPRPAPAVPWFWSDQYDVKLQVAGLSAGFDDIILRGDNQAGRSFSVAYLREGHLIALDAINQPRDFAAAKRLIQTGARVDHHQISDPSIPLKDAVTEVVGAVAS